MTLGSEQGYRGPATNVYEYMYRYMYCSIRTRFYMHHLILFDKQQKDERYRAGLSRELAPHMDLCKLYRTRPARPVTNFTLSRTAWRRGLGVIRRRPVALRA